MLVSLALSHLDSGLRVGLHERCYHVKVAARRSAHHFLVHAMRRNVRYFELDHVHAMCKRSQLTFGLILPVLFHCHWRGRLIVLISEYLLDLGLHVRVCKCWQSGPRQLLMRVGQVGTAQQSVC